MSVPPAPGEIEHLTRRPFAFYPPILNIEHNEWQYRRATWSEILVANSKSGLELWIPRRLLGAVSAVEEPVMILGLQKELEYKAGTVWPHDRRILPMPAAAGEIPRPLVAAPASAAPRAGTHRPQVSSTESRIGRLIGAMMATGILLCFLVVFFFRAGPVRSRVVFTAKDQAFLELSRLDDYFGVASKLGPPAEDRWRSETGELQYRRLWYPQRGYYVVLMGPDRKNARYIGALDRNWRVIHYVELAGGGNTASMLRSLPRF